MFVFVFLSFLFSTWQHTNHILAGIWLSAFWLPSYINQLHLHRIQIVWSHWLHYGNIHFILLVLLFWAFSFSFIMWCSKKVTIATLFLANVTLFLIITIWYHTILTFFLLLQLYSSTCGFKSCNVPLIFHNCSCKMLLFLILNSIIQLLIFIFYSGESRNRLP